jgi:hypothetical protein
MNISSNVKSASGAAFLILALFASAPDAAARNIFDGFTKAPTFTPPEGCEPVEHAYGVLARCEKKIEPGRTFVALVDVAVGWGVGTKRFVDDQVAEIKAYWQQYAPGNQFAFTSKPSEILPANAPAEGTECREYSISIEFDKKTAEQTATHVEHVEGLTCAWFVEKPANGKPNVELFWLEAYDGFKPQLGQKPMESFDLIVKELFQSIRL